MSDALAMLSALPPATLAAAGIAGAAFLGALALREHPLHRRLRQLSVSDTAEVAPATPRERARRLAKSLVKPLGLTPSVADPDIRLRLKAAGFDSAGAAELFVVLRVLLPFVFFGLGYAFIRLVSTAQNEVNWALMMGAMAGLMGYVLPSRVVSSRIQKRRKAIQRAWPDALDLLVLTIEAGLPLDAALSRVASEISGAAPTLSQELKITIAEMLLLPSRREAFENLAERTDLVMIRRVVAAIIQVEEYGGELSSALRTQARETRQLRISAAERRAAGLPPLLTIPMVLFLMPSLFAIILTPSLISIFSGP